MPSAGGCSEKLCEEQNLVVRRSENEGETVTVGCV